MKASRSIALVAVLGGLWVAAASAQTGGTGTGGTGGSTGGGSTGGFNSGGGGLSGGQGFGPGSLGGTQQGQNFAPTESTKTTTSATKNGNPFNAYYANPMALGLAGATSTSGGVGTGPGYRSTGTGTGAAASTAGNSSFSAALYPNLYTNTTGTTGTNMLAGGRSTGLGGFGTTGLGGTSGFGGRGMQGMQGMQGINGGTGTGTRSYGYVIGNVSLSTPSVTPSPQTTPVAPPEFRTSLQQVIARSTSLGSRDGIQVHTDGNAVVLRGTVANDRDRRLAKNVLRLTPGVRQVRNELEVAVPATRVGQ